MDTAPGTIVGGKYRVLRELGQGGMGVVLAARQESLGRDVALKVLHPRFAQSEEIALRLTREARAAAALRHPNVVDVLDVDRDERGAPFLVLELLEGETLAALLRRKRRLTLEEAAEILLPAMDGIALAHARGIVHRDIKPANLFLHRDARGAIVPKVLDFGVAKAAGDDAGLTATEATLGTPLYMSPEHVESAKQVGPQADVWAMGVTWCEALSGSRPHDVPLGASAYQVLSLIAREEPRSLDTLVDDAPPGLSRILDRALERDPRKRYADMAAFVDALTTVLPTLATVVDRRGARPAPIATPRRAAKRGRAFAYVGAACLTAGVIAASVQFFAAPPSEPAPVAAPVLANAAPPPEPAPQPAPVRDLAQLVSGLEIAWGEERADVERGTGPTIDVLFESCRAPFVEMRQLDGPAGIGGGPLTFSYSRTEGLFEVFATSPLERDALIADVERALQLPPTRTPVGARWDLGGERLTIAASGRGTTLRVFHRLRQARYAEAAAICD